MTYNFQRRTKKKHKWTETMFLSALEFEHGMAAVETTRHVLEWSAATNLPIWWGEGQIRGSFCPLIRHEGVTHFPFGLWTTGHLEIGFQFMLPRPVFNMPSKRVELLERLNAIDGIDLPIESLQRRPRFPIVVLESDTRLTHFFAVWDWFIQELHAPSL